MGRTHALSGAVAALGLTPAASTVFQLQPATVATTVVLTAGAAMLPDLDHPHATAAHTFGPATRLVGKAVCIVSGGHRKGTHSVVGVLAFTALVYAATLAPTWVAGLVMWMLAALAFDPFVGKRSHLPMLAATGALAAATALFNPLPTLLLPTIVAVGTVTHIAGDAVTEQGVPLAWPLSGRNIRFGTVDTGKWVERRIVVPILIVVGLAAAITAFQ